MSARVLVLDQGGHSSRALVFDESGAIVAHAAVPLASEITESGGIEQDPCEIVVSLWSVLQQVARQCGESFREIEGLALIVQRSSLLAWDSKSRKAISPVLSWQDTRNAVWLERVVAGHRQAIREQTGLYPNAHYGVSKMHWLLQNVPDVQLAAASGTLFILPLASYLQQQLTDAEHPLVDAVIASRTLLTATGALTWSPALLKLFDIPARVLPCIKPTRADYGCVTVAGVELPLKLLGGDQSFFSLSYPEKFDENVIFINAGTGVFIQQKMSADRVPHRLLRAPLMVSADQEESVVVAEGTVNSAASALDWLWARAGKVYSAAEWNAAMQQSDSDAVPFFINRLTATGSPDWLPAGDSFFSRPSSTALEAVAVLESIVFSIQRNIECLADVQPSTGLVISGGLAQLEVFCQCLADLSCKPVWRSDDVEACARGAALQLLPSMNYRHSFRQYTPQQRPLLQSRYRQWSAAMNQLSCSG